MSVRPILVAAAAALALFSVAPTAALACGAAPMIDGPITDPAVNPDPSPTDIAAVSQSKPAKPAPKARPGRAANPARPAAEPDSAAEPAG